MTETNSNTITTLCLNPAIDVTYHVNKMIADQKSRSDLTRKDPGGNGINIGRSLHRMQIHANTFCVIAGNTGKLLQEILKPQLENIFYESVSGETRINSTIIELDSQTQYQITDSGTQIPPKQLQKVITDFVQQTAKGFGIITGSCQPNIPTNLYAELVTQINHAGGKAVIDTHGEALKLAINAKPFLIKPNRYELETILGHSLPSVTDVAVHARRIQQQGVTHVCVSLGEQGAVLVSPNNSYYARALKVSVNNTVGAGDSMVAGLVAGFSLGKSPEETLRYGIACGAGTVMHPGTELFSNHELASFRQHATVEKLDL